MGGIFYWTTFLCMLVIVSARYHRQSDAAKEELEQYIEEKKLEINQRYRPHYHVAGPVGWINDPNGFSFYNGEYHLFYQYYPYDSVWGPMHWGHVSSPDLVHWNQLPTALLPDEEMCFSGSAVVDEDTMIIIYTGHEIIEEEPFYKESQYLAYSNNGIDFYKYEGNPVLPEAPNGSPDFRDPKAWRYGDYWYVILGSKTIDDKGRVLLYRSTDMKDWEFLNVLGESNGELGYMWECPDFFELDGRYVLLMSPQGMEPQGDRYKNIDQNGYIIGRFDYDSYEFVPEVDFQEIDFGHDFYAAQTTEKDGKRYLVAWFNTWDKEYPEAVDGWAGMMTIVREINLVGDRIYMSPVDEMVDLREDVPIVGDFSQNQQLIVSKAAELNIEGNLDEKIEILIEGSLGGDKAWLRWNPDDGKVSVDRGSDDIRQVEWQATISANWRVFLDSSSLELFCGEGEVVFSSRLYPEGDWKITNLSPQIVHIEAYDLKTSVPV